MPTLNWLTRKDDIKASGQVPYRILEPAAEGVYGDPDSGSLLIQGDNLDALKSLLPFYAGSVQCIYIDPPFNTGQAFANYDDNLEHTLWLQIMYPRSLYLYKLLNDKGSLFVHLDDNELDYMKIILDDIFGRKNFVSRITLHARSPSAFSTVNPGVFKSSEYLLWYSKDKTKMYQDRVWVPRLPDMAYNKWIDNPESSYSDWTISPIAPKIKERIRNIHSIKRLQKVISDFYVENAHRIIRFGEIDDQGAGQDIVSVKNISIEQPNKTFIHNRQKYGEIFILNGQQILFYKKNIREIDGEESPVRMLTNIWDDIAWEGIAKEGGVRFPKAKKPEKLIRRILQLATQPNDLVLDSFLGSGTTAAVAHKMNRRWIGIEMGEHAHTHCIPRLEKVIAGEQGGISKAVNWQGGGGFRFLRLGETIFLPGGYINPQVTFAGLAAHLWFTETRTPFDGADQSPFLGVHDHTGYALLYNGILRDKKANGGNVLTTATLNAIRRGAPNGFNGPVVVYANGCRFGKARMRAENLECKQLPYDCEQR